MYYSQEGLSTKYTNVLYLAGYWYWYILDQSSLSQNLCQTSYTTPYHAIRIPPPTKVCILVNYFCLVITSLFDFHTDRYETEGWRRGCWWCSDATLAAAYGDTMISVAISDRYSAPRIINTVSVINTTTNDNLIHCTGGILQSRKQL